MLLDWKNKFRENEYINQSNLQIQCNPYQIISGIFHRTRKFFFHSLYGNTNCLEKEMATHFSILAWRISLTEQSGGLQSLGSQRVGHDRVHQEKEIPPGNPEVQQLLC